jgi:hypothetical protein
MDPSNIYQLLNPTSDIPQAAANVAILEEALQSLPLAEETTPSEAASEEYQLPRENNTYKVCNDLHYGSNW